MLSHLHEASLHLQDADYATGRHGADPDGETARLHKECEVYEERLKIPDRDPCGSSCGI